MSIDITVSHVAGISPAHLCSDRLVLTLEISDAQREAAIRTLVCSMNESAAAKLLDELQSEVSA